MPQALTVGVVLAGGTASRLGGGDKPLLQVGHDTMLARAIKAMMLPKIAISANGDPARFAAYGCPVLSDGEFTGFGPLAGLLAGLEWACSLGAASLLTIPGDTPFVPEHLVTSLTPPPACAATGAYVHHLIALWPVEARLPLRECLETSGQRHVVRFARSIGMRRVDFPPATWDRFLNVNTPADLAEARSRAGAPPAGSMENGE